jgi:hypothetical protein
MPDRPFRLIAQSLDGSKVAARVVAASTHDLLVAM